MWPLLLSVSALAAAPRHALIIGENNGPSAMGILRYAEDDARRMAEVLTQLGDFPADQVTVLYGPDLAEVQAALARHAEIARKADDDLFLFYYSGHADGTGLRLGDETLPYAALRRAVRDMPAEVRVGILDACRSGEITRVKGLEVSSPFAVDRGYVSQGEAWLTATAAEESAQESDVLRGSFFTYGLVTGLRGAADRDDGVVSLAEAYAYAYDSTVARTGTSSNGVQHPAYDFRLQGRGDLPLTEVRRAEALLVLPEDMQGQIDVLRMPDQALLAEVHKAPGLQLTLGLPAGRYLLRNRDGGLVQEAKIGLTAGSTLNVRGFQATDLAQATAKGDAPDLAIPAPDADEPPPVEIPLAEPEGAAEADEPSAEGSPSGRMLAGLDQKMGAALNRAAGKLIRLSAPVAASLESRRRPPRDPPRELRVEALPEGCQQEPMRCVEARAEESGLPDGPVVLRLGDGTVLAEGRLSGGARTGRWTFWQGEGQRLAEGAYVAGQQGGTWTWWYPSGHRWRRGSYDQGREDGLWTEWYEGGGRKMQFAYARGVLEGRWTEWYEDGTRKREGSTHQGQPEGRWTEWHDNGARAARGDFHQGQREGKWRTWYDNGQMESVGRYEADLVDGRWRSWYPDGKVQSRGRYADGQPRRIRSFNEDGSRVR